MMTLLLDNAYQKTVLGYLPGEVHFGSENDKSTHLHSYINSSGRGASDFVSFVSFLHRKTVSIETICQISRNKIEIAADLTLRICLGFGYISIITFR